MRTVGLHLYARLTAIATFVLLIAGSLVTSNDAGLAVPDWPLSYGMWFPPMVGGIFYEHGHRMIAGVVALMILGLAVCCARSEKRLWVRRLSYAALAAVIFQALLGGLTVLLLLPPAISIAHACLGQTVFCLVVAVAAATHPRWKESPPGILSVAVARLAMAMACLAVFQLVMGAAVRHTGAMAAVHITGAVLFVLVLGVFKAMVFRSKQTPPAIRKAAMRLGLLLVIQLAAGAAVYFHRSVVVLRTLHVATGALILVQAVMLAWDYRRRSAR